MRFAVLVLSVVLFIVLLVGIADVKAAVICVPNTGIDPSCTSSESTISVAISNGSSGDTILVGPGNYTEDSQIRFTTNLTLISTSGALSTIIQHSSATANLIVIAAGSDGSILGKANQGFTITGQTSGAAIIVSDTDFNTIEGNIISGNKTSISLQNNADSNVIRTNTIQNAIQDGILITNGTQNEIIANEIIDGDSTGIKLQSPTTFTLIDSNRIDNNARFGIDLSACTCSDNLITRNTIVNNTLRGVSATGATNNNTVEKNVIVGNGEGFSTDNSNNTAFNNWWGCNEGPTDSDCDSASANFSPWLVIDHSISQTSIDVSEQTTARVVLNTDANFTDGDPTSIPIVFPDTALNGVTVTFNTVAGTGSGNYTNGSDVVADGVATDTFNCDNSGTVTANATVDSETNGISLTCAPTLSDPTIDKAFSPSTIVVGGTTTLTLTLTNTDGSSTLTNLAFTDSLPSGVEIAATPNIGGTCNSNNVLATHFTPNLAASGTAINLVSGSGYGLAASASCTITVDVTGTTSGSKNNTTSALTSTETPSSTDTASDTLTVLDYPTIDKAFSPDTISVGGTSTLTFTLTNPNTGTGLTGLNFTDTLPTGVEVAATPNLGGTCGAVATNFTPNIAAGITSINLTSGVSLAASGSCTITVDVTATTSGSKVNTTGAIGSTETGAGSDTATDTLTISAEPEIDVQRPAGTSIADDNSDAQGSVAAGSPTTITYTVRNTGTGTLNVTNITSASTSNVTVNNITPTRFTVASDGGTATFDVNYTVTGVGAFSFELVIANDDSDENPYNITVSGTGTTPSSFALGDPDNDSDVDILDARICLQIATGEISGTVDQQDACDVNGDNVVTVEDAEQIAEFAIGLRGSVSALGVLASMMLFLGLPLFALISCKRRSILTFGLFFGGLVVLVAGCTLFPVGTTALIASTTDQYITVTVTNMPDGGLASFSADAGGFTFNPHVISVDGIQALGGFELLASQIDNANGEVRFGIANPSGGIISGSIILMKISVKVADFSPDQADVKWLPGRLTLGSGNNNILDTGDYLVYPR